MDRINKKQLFGLEKMRFHHLVVVNAQNTFDWLSRLAELIHQAILLMPKIGELPLQLGDSERLGPEATVLWWATLSSCNQHRPAPVGIFKSMMGATGFLTSFKLRSGQAQVFAPKNLILRFIVLANVLLLAMTAIGAERQITDPIFGLSYSSDLVLFDKAPSSIVSACPDLVTSRWDRQMWVFAWIDEKDSSYIVLGGLFVKRNGIRKASPDRNGVMLRLTGQKCELLGPAREMFEFGDAEVGRATLTRIAYDAVSRYTRAFRGVDRFRAAFQRQHIDLGKSGSLILRDAVASAN